MNKYALYSSSIQVIYVVQNDIEHPNLNVGVNCALILSEDVKIKAFPSIPKIG